MKITVKSLDELRKTIAESDGSPLEIKLPAGNYYADSTVEINGKKNIKITGDDDTRIIGGKPLRGVSRVTDPEILERVSEEWHDSLFVIDMAENGYSAADIAFDGGYAVGIQVDGKAMQLSQYPRRGKYLKITNYVEKFVPTVDDGWGKVYGLMNEGICFKDEHVKSWKDTSDIWVNGFWIYDWMNSRFPALDFDPVKQSFRVVCERGHYNGLERVDADLFRVGQRIFFYNVLEELNEPGTYYVDRKNCKIYFIAPENSGAEEVIVTTLASDIFKITDSENITVDNLTLEAARGKAVRAKNCKHLDILMCVVRNIKESAIDCNKCERTSVKGCAIYDCDNCGISLSCGDRKNLRPGRSVISGNHIYRMGRFCFCNSGGICVDGVGITIENNLIHDMPHSAIFYSGNDVVIKHNEMYSLVQETGDAGAIYSGRDYSAGGNVIKENYIHHLGGVGIGAMGVYNDDCLSGTHMERNVFVSVSRACMLGGGRGLVADNNLFIGCFPAVEMDSRGEPDAKIWRNIMRDLSHGVKEHLRGCPKYLKKYPEKQEIIDRFDAETELPHIQPEAKLRNNLFCGCNDFKFAMGGISGDLEMHNNLDIEPEDFMGFDNRDYRVRRNSLACRRGFRNIDMSKIGLCGLPCRSEDPKVFSNMTMDKGNIHFTVTNMGDKTVEARYDFSANVSFEEHPSLFHMTYYRFRETIAPGETVKKTFTNPYDFYQATSSDSPLLKDDHKYRFFAGSPDPGCRPSEIFNKVVIRKLGK